MRCGGSVLRLYDLLRDQGSIIAGFLALIAGWIAYRGARRAAEQQVAAMNAQTEAVRQQNRDLRNESRRQLAHERIVSVTLLSSVVLYFRNDLTKLIQILEQPGRRIVPQEYRHLIYKPPLHIVWNDLRACGALTISDYIQLDTCELAKATTVVSPVVRDDRRPLRQLARQPRRTAVPRSDRAGPSGQPDARRGRQPNSPRRVLEVRIHSPPGKSHANFRSLAKGRP